MNEFIYRLNLPKLPKVLKDDFDINKTIPKNFHGSKIYYYHPSELFKNEWCNFLGYEWDYVSFFVRAGYAESCIHRDNPLSPDQLHWGINWIHGEKTLMEYWNLDDIDKEGILVDTGGKETVFLKMKSGPIKSYIMEPGVYLVNASAPHRAKNLGEGIRFAVSLRSKKIRNTEEFKTWDKVVEKFRFLFL